jgi:cell division protein ZapE
MLQYRITDTVNIREAYDESLLREGHTRDPAQEKIVERLLDLQNRLLDQQTRNTGLRRFFSRQTNRDYRGERGLYIWGGVGRGKTFLMDLFFESVEIDAKRRIHFHRMMHDVHRRLKELADVADPLDTVAADIAAETRLLCFDEFFVSDIGDAMLLGRLLDGLFQRGVTLVTTSNSPPDGLYKNGLQRQRFAPAIDLLNRFTDVINMDGETDYRLRLLQQAGTYLSPDDARAEKKLQRFFDESASSQIKENQMLDINGREIRTRKSAKGIAWFDFVDICDGPRSQLDYIEIARWYPTVIVSGVPVLDGELESPARRFIALVDEFYDRRVKLIISAATDIDTLYSGNKLSFEFARTTSRIIEMQSTDYLASPHLA